MTTHSRRGRSGPGSLFRGKVRKTVSITLTPKHREQVARAMQRLDLTRADVIALMIELHADALMPYDVARFRGADDSVSD